MIPKFHGSLGIFVVYFSDRVDTLEQKRVMFLMGKIIVGFANGVMNTAFLTIVSEIAPTRIRGPLLSCFTFFIVSYLGSLSFSTLTHFRSLPNSVGLLWSIVKSTSYFQLHTV